MNRLLLVGRIGKDPEYNHTSNGISNCSFSIAIDAQFKDKSGNRQTYWFNCVAWRNTADYISKYCHKGDKIGIDGNIQSRTYETQDGNKRTVVEVVCDSVEIMSSGNAKQDASGFTPVDDDDELPF